MSLDWESKEKRKAACMMATLLEGHDMKFFAVAVSTAFNYTWSSKPNNAAYGVYAACANGIFAALGACKEACSHDDFVQFNPLAADEIFVGLCGDPDSIKSLAEMIEEDEESVRDWVGFSDDDWAEYDEWKEENEQP